MSAALPRPPHAHQDSGAPRAARGPPGRAAAGAQRRSIFPNFQNATASRPDRDEHRRDGEPGLVDVEAGHEVPESAADVQLAGEQPGDLDGPDQEGGGDRQARDDDVVVHLAHRAGEGPAVGEVHEAPVQGVEQGHAPGEQQRQRQDGVPGQALGSGRGGGGQQQDLGGGVKADPEDEPDEEHVPGLGDRAHERTEEPPHDAAGLQFPLELRLVEPACPQAAEYPDDPGQHDHVEGGDQVEEAGRQRGAYHSADALVSRAGVDDRTEHRLGRDAQADADHDDDRGVAEGEEEPRAERPFLVGHELARGVVDRGDVIGVECVPGTERPGRERHPEP